MFVLYFQRYFTDSSLYISEKVEKLTGIKIFSKCRTDEITLNRESIQSPSLLKLKHLYFPT